MDHRVGGLARRALLAALVWSIVCSGCDQSVIPLEVPVPFDIAGFAESPHPWMTIHGDPGNRHFLPLQTGWQFRWRETILPTHRNVSGLVTHANGDAYFLTATMPPARDPERPLLADTAEQAYLSRYSSTERRIVQQVPLSVEAFLSAPLLAPDGTIYSVEAERVVRWSEDLRPLSEIPLYDPPGLDRAALLLPYRHDGAASMNYDARHQLIHAITICGRWITIDAASGRLSRPIESLGLFVTNTPAVDSATGRVLVVGVPHAAALANFDEPPAPRSSLLLPEDQRDATRAEILQQDDLRFVDVLLLGLFGDLFGASGGQLIALEPDGETYGQRQADFAGSSETSPTLGYDGSIYIGDGLGNLLAFDAALGEKWSFPLPGGESFGSACIDPSGAVYVVAGEPRSIGIYKLRDRGDHAEQEWFVGGSRLIRGSTVEEHDVQLVSSIFTPTASGVGFCVGYEASALETLIRQTRFPVRYELGRFGAEGRVFAVDLRTGRLLHEAGFATFSFIGAHPLGGELLVPSFDLFDDRFGLPFKAAGIRIYEFENAPGG